MKKENVFKKELGKYVNIRSSESPEMMICWNTPEYDADCGRWFESNGCSYYSDEHAKDMQNADSLDMLQMRRRHPELSVKETFCEITYLKGKQRAEVYVVCNEYKKGRTRTFTVVLDDANEKETGKKDQPCNPSYFRDEFKKAIGKVEGVRVLTPHSCRHTYVSQMQALGVDLQTIQSIVGHADVDMTEHYLRVQEPKRLEAVDLFSKAFGIPQD
jgi:hypothetical protein